MAMGHERILNMHMNIHAYKRVHMDIIAWLHGCIRLDVSRIIVHMHGSKLVYAHQYLNAKCSALRWLQLATLVGGLLRVALTVWNHFSFNLTCRHSTAQRGQQWWHPNTINVDITTDFQNCWVELCTWYNLCLHFLNRWLRSWCTILRIVKPPKSKIQSSTNYNLLVKDTHVHLHSTTASCNGQVLSCHWL